MSQNGSSVERDPDGSRPLGVQALRGLGMAATIIMLAAGVAALIGAALLLQWARAQEELAALWGVIVLAMVALPLAVTGLLLLGAGLRGIGAFRGRQAPNPGGGHSRFNPLASIGNVLILLAIIAITVWAVAADRLVLGAAIIGVVIVFLFGVEAIRDFSQRRRA